MQSYSKEDLNHLQKQKKQHQKWMWIVLIGCLFIQAIPFFMFTVLPLNFFYPTDWNQWASGNAAALSLVVTFGILLASMCAPLIAKLFKSRVNLRVIYIGGLTLSTLAFIAIGFTPNIKSTGGVVAFLILCNVLAQTGSIVFSGLGINNLISQWWPSSQRGRALGLVFVGAGIGNYFWQHFTGFLHSEFTGSIIILKYVILAFIAFVLGASIMFTICKKPTLKQDQINMLFKPAKSNADTHEVSVSFLNTKNNSFYWMLVIGYLFIQMTTAVVSVQATTYVAVNKGKEFLTTFNIIVATCALVSSVVGGIMNDKLGPFKSVMIGLSFQGLALIALFLTNSDFNFIYLYAVAFGSSTFVYNATPAFLCNRLYGSKFSGMHLGFISMFMALGFSISGPIAGSIIGNLQTSTTWNYAWLYGAVTLSLAAIFSLTAIKKISSNGNAKYFETYNHYYSKALFNTYGYVISYYALKIILFKKDFRYKNYEWRQKILDKQKNFKPEIAKLVDKAKQNEAVQVKKFKDKNQAKNKKLDLKITKATNIKVDPKKEEAYNLKINKKIERLMQKRNDYLSFIKSDQQISNRTKIINQLDQKITNLKKQFENTNASKIALINSCKSKLEQAQLSNSNSKIINNLTSKLNKLSSDQIKNAKKCETKINLLEEEKIDLKTGYMTIEKFDAKIETLNSYLNKYQNKKDNLIKFLNQKKFEANYVLDFELTKIKTGYDKVEDLYRHKYLLLDSLIDDKIKQILMNKDMSLKRNLKYQQLVNSL